MLADVVEMLGSLADEMVFLGGCATGLLITDPAAPEIRRTRDVDAPVAVTSRLAYHRLSRDLRSRGFAEDTSPDAHIARWRCGAHVLDVMPTDSDILGFGNPWYELAFQSAEEMVLPGGRTIHLISAPVFLATKLAAFDGRGAGDYLASHDIEDLVAVVDGRAGVVDELNGSDDRLVAHLRDRVAGLLDDHGFQQALPGLLDGDAGSQSRREVVLRRLQAIAGRER